MGSMVRLTYFNANIYNRPNNTLAARLGVRFAMSACSILR